MKQILVSLIVPVYNVEKYVGRCLDSLIQQGYKQIEIIVVDDGSTDGSGKVCDKYANSDKRIKVFHKKNGGLSSARNFGIKKAKGEYVCLIDSDDRVKRDFVNDMMNEVSTHGADVVICGYNEQLPEAKILTGKEATVRLLTKQENMEIIACNKLYKRSLFESITYPEGKNYEDSLTTYKLLSKAQIVAYVAKSLYIYEMREGSITHKDKKEERLKFREMAAREAMDYFAKDSELEYAAKIAMLTAKLAWVDFAISGDVAKEYFNEGIKWIKLNRNSLLKNKYLNGKLRIYILLTTNFSGIVYTLFRRIRHE